MSIKKTKRPEGNKTNHKANSGSFKPGPDPTGRRNVHGMTSKAQLQAGRKITAALVAEGEATIQLQIGTTLVEATNYEILAKVIWREARSAKAPFVEMILDRIEGKVSQPIQGDLNLAGALSISALRASMSARAQLAAQDNPAEKE
jgi:hypothetical protein